MEVFPLDPEHATRYESLLGFLEACRDEAEDKDHDQLVSIATETEALDPLSVLDSIYETEQLHFYVERKQEGFAIAGAEVAIAYVPESGDRFSSTKAFIEETLSNSIGVGDESLPFFGPHFFCGFSFFDKSEPDTPFPSSTVFVPLWQVGLSNERCVAIANVLVGKGSDVEALAKRIWNANTKFNAIKTEGCVSSYKSSDTLEVVETSEVGGQTRFGESVSAALESIRGGELKKVVIARALDLVADGAFHPLEILNTLRERYPDCYAFSLANGLGQSFIGASPERLVSVRKNVINVDILAGTARRGVESSEDERMGSELLSSEKDLREHRFVFESVRRRLKELGVSNEQQCEPDLKKLQNVQHLYVNLESELPNGIHILDLLQKLHPTPAVGGMPRESALSKISELEPFDRGLYAGPIGWVNAKGEGEFLVAIRSALVDGKRARLFAGVGIVEGSDAEKEMEETNLKFKALQENLL